MSKCSSIKRLWCICTQSQTRRWLPRIADTAAGVLGALAVFVLFIVYTTIHPLDPLLGGIAPLILGVLLISGMITSFVIATLRPRATLATPAP